MRINMKFKFMGCLIMAFLVSLLPSCGDDDGREDEPDYPYEEDAPSTPGNTDGNENNDTQLNLENIIKQNVKVSDDFDDYIWTFKVTSTLETALPEKKISYAVMLENNKCYNKSDLRNNKYQNYSETESGETKVVRMSTPFWYYYLNDDSKDLEAMVTCEMYYASYLQLQGKTDLSKDEKSLMSRLSSLMKQYAKDAQWLDATVLVVIDSKTYKIYNKSFHGYYTIM